MAKYSSNDEIDDIVEELVGKGFRFERGGVHGKLFTSDNRFVAIVPGSPSDFRAALNFRGDIRRALRALDLPLLDADQVLKDQKERKVALNNPFAGLAEATKKPALTPKPLTETEFLLVVQLRDVENKSFSDVSKILTAMGFTKKTGKPLNENCVAVWFYYWRRKTEPNQTEIEEPTEEVEKEEEVNHSKPVPIQRPPFEPTPASPPATVPLFNPPKSKLLTEVTELISSNLTESMKERFLIALFEEYRKGDA